MKFTAVVLGDALIDEIETPAQATRHVGGAALNLAAGLQALGTQTTLIASVADDDDGAMIGRHLAARSIALHATAAPLGTGVARSNRIHGEPRYEFNSAARRRSYALGDAERRIDVDLLAVNSFPVDRDAQTLVDLIEQSDAFVAYDPNPRLGLIGRLPSFVDGFERVAAQSDLVKVSDEDAQMLYALPLTDVVERLLGLGLPIVVTTAGSGGMAVATAEGLRVAVPIVDLPGEVVDTMGAGDATLAAVLHQILDGGVPADESGWREYLRFAQHIAALTCRSFGADIRLP